MILLELPRNTGDFISIVDLRVKSFSVGLSLKHFVNWQTLWMKWSQWSSFIVWFWSTIGPLVSYLMFYSDNKVKESQFRHNCDKSSIVCFLWVEKASFSLEHLHLQICLIKCYSDCTNTLGKVKNLSIITIALISVKVLCKNGTI